MYLFEKGYSLNYNDNYKNELIKLRLNGKSQVQYRIPEFNKEPSLKYFNKISSNNFSKDLCLGVRRVVFLRVFMYMLL
ncbi:MAG: hypothetical protein A2X18_05115 [Bacteroidetes bacterium GWF2_40_14]|nr:MAG: hypothetical protein A2X18_05115 [Bacteroidetes bacterium GWF2_40_14]